MNPEPFTFADFTAEQLASLKAKRATREFLRDEVRDCLFDPPQFDHDERMFASLSKASVAAALREGAQACGNKVIRVHDLRHSHCPFLLIWAFRLWQ